MRSRQTKMSPFGLRYDMTEILQKQIPYPRPTKFSDPNYDFTPEECAAILAVPDERMGFWELGNNFRWIRFLGRMSRIRLTASSSSLSSSD